MRSRIISLCVIFLLSGCAILRNISGNSMSVLQRVTHKAQSDIFDYTLEDCFQKVLAFLKSERIEAEILRIDRRNYSILALVSRPSLENIDGTFAGNCADVAIFFMAEGNNKTKIRINSLSSLFAEYTLDKIFNELRPKTEQKLQEEPEK
jgi:hypothetical protein